VVEDSTQRRKGEGTAPKGQNKKARGNALGSTIKRGKRCRRAIEHSAPMGLVISRDPFPRALPWAFLFLPLRGSGRHRVER